MNYHSSAKSFFNERLEGSSFEYRPCAPDQLQRSRIECEGSTLAYLNFISLLRNLATVHPTHGHTRLRIGDPVRSRIHKQSRDQLVVGWVTTSES